MKEVRYYSSFDEDFITTKQQYYKLPEDYRWLRLKPLDRILSWVIYTSALIFSSVYCRAVLHIKFKNRNVIKQAKKQGAFIYANHTQPFGDVFIPALAAFPKRIYTVVSPANLGIPVLGRILPYLGALPTADTLGGIKKLNEAISYRLSKGRIIVIYPEAHVWEYCTEIRPFPDTSFKFAVKEKKAVYAMTVTYRKRRFGKRPDATVYVDGPFYPKEGLTPKENTAYLHKTVTDIMLSRSSESNYSYIEYIKKEN